MLKILSLLIFAPILVLASCKSDMNQANKYYSSNKDEALYYYEKILHNKKCTKYFNDANIYSSNIRNNGWVFQKINGFHVISKSWNDKFSKNVYRMGRFSIATKKNLSYKTYHISLQLIDDNKLLEKDNSTRSYSNKKIVKMIDIQTKSTTSNKYKTTLKFSKNKNNSRIRKFKLENNRDNFIYEEFIGEVSYKRLVKDFLKSEFLKVRFKLNTGEIRTYSLRLDRFSTALNKFSNSLK